jgi:hypothetical protein
VAHPLKGKKQNPEHVAKRQAAVARNRAGWSEEKKAAWRQKISANSASGRIDVRERNAEGHRGRIPWNKGNRWQDKLSPEARHHCKKSARSTPEKPKA